VAPGLQTYIESGQISHAVNEHAAVADGGFVHLRRSGYGRGLASEVVRIFKTPCQEKKSGAVAVFSCFHYAVAV
jgi:hypothetical protein